jgi:hypothetical protein
LFLMMILRFSDRLQPAAVKSVATFNFMWLPTRPARNRNLATSPRDVAEK